TLTPYPVPLPPAEEQSYIGAEVERRLSIVAEVEAQVDVDVKRAARLRQSILKRAFEGKLVAQDPTDEQASVLLDRIRAQREQHETESDEREAGKPRRRLVAGKRTEPKGIYFSRGALASYIVRALSDSPDFGRTQLEKMLYLTQAHLD